MVINNVRSYLEKTGALARQQLHFPRCDATRYKDLYNEKVSTRGILSREGWQGMLPENRKTPFLQQCMSALF